MSRAQRRDAATERRWPAAAALLLLGVLVALGCTQGPAMCLGADEAAAYAPFAPAREVRILTVNVWSGLTYEGLVRIGRYPDELEKRYEALIAGIRVLSPDIIAIQEANPLPHYAERLAADLDYRVVYSVALGGVRFGPVGIPFNLREGNAVLARKDWALAETAKGRLSGCGVATNWFCLHFGEITQVLMCRAVVNGKPLYVCNVHLHSGPFRGAGLEEALARLGGEFPGAVVAEARQRAEEDMARRNAELANLNRFLGETLPPGAPAVLLGDFNTTRQSGELDALLAEDKWLDSFSLLNPGTKGSTWDPLGNSNIALQTPGAGAYGLLCAYQDRHPARLDLILLSNIPRERIVQSRVVLTPSEGFCASDHYGVLTTVIW